MIEHIPPTGYISIKKKLRRQTGNLWRNIQALNIQGRLHTGQGCTQDKAAHRARLHTGQGCSTNNCVMLRILQPITTPVSFVPEITRLCNRMVQAFINFIQKHQLGVQLRYKRTAGLSCIRCFVLAIFLYEPIIYSIYSGSLYSCWSFSYRYWNSYVRLQVSSGHPSQPLMPHWSFHQRKVEKKFNYNS